MAAPAYDWLDSMIWSVGIASVVIGVSALKSKINNGVADDGNNGSFLGASAFLLLLIGLFLFVSGLAIGIIWPFPMSGGVYNVLFSGASALGGIMLIAISITLIRKVDLRILSYGALLFGIYLFDVAYSIASYKLTKTPDFSATIFSVLGLASILSVPATHLRNTWILRIFAVVAIVAGLLWLFEAYNVTYSHLAPPPPQTTTTPKSS